MHTPKTMSELLKRIEDAIQSVVTTIEPLSASQLVEPRLSDGRSVKDVLAHLAWWDRWLLYTLPVPSDAAQPYAAPALYDQIPNTTLWADEMNEKVTAYNRSRGLASVQAEFDATRQQLLNRVKQLDWDDLHDPNGMSARIGLPVAPLILGIYEHYEEHAHEFGQL